MKNLVFSALVLAAFVPATGCIFVDDDDSDDDIPSDDDPVDEPTELNVTWSLFSNAEAALCQPGTNPTATLYACEGTCAAGSPQPFADITDCPATAGTGTITVPASNPALALPPGNYTIWVEFAANGAVYAKSFSDPVTLVAGQPVNHDFDVQVDHGFFDLAWSLVTDQGAATCADVEGEAGIGIDVGLCVDPACVNPPVADPVAINFPSCEDGSGRGGPVQFNGANPYSFTASVIDAQGDAIVSSGDNVETAPPFEYGNEAQTVGTIVIPLD